MARPDSHGQKRGPGAARRRGTTGGAVPIADLVGRTLKDLGVPSQRLTRRVLEAWQRAADPAWREEARPTRFVGGVLEVEVDGAPLRQELSQFHRARLLDVLRAALPDRTITGLRFAAAPHPSERPSEGPASGTTAGERRAPPRNGD